LRLWIDIVCPSQAHIFKNLIPELRGEELMITSTRFAETTELLRGYGIESRVVGEHLPKKGLYKKVKVLERLLGLLYGLDGFDASLSFQNFYAPIAAKMRGRKNITMLDNDLPSFDYRAIMKFADYILAPEVIPEENITRYARDTAEVHSFPGYKEDIYIADYVPDEEFPEKIPFEEYVVVRPEALFSIYVRNGRSIVPELLDSLVGNDFNVVYLPRTAEDLKLAGKKAGIHVPGRPLNGLDLCWYSQGVLTGSGTFAREAACMGVASVSFFPEKLLSVDAQLVREGRIFHSRDAQEIIEYLDKNRGRGKNSLNDSRRVKKTVVDTINGILDGIRAS